MFKGLVPRLAMGAIGVACQLTSAVPAQAAGRVLPQKGTSIHVSALRLAEARAPEWKTLWLSMRVGGGPGKFALVLPAPDGTSIDRSLDAFFDALDHATAPRIRPPDGTPICGKTAQSSFDDLSEKRTSSAAAESAIVLDTATDVNAYADSLGLSFGTSDSDALAAMPSAMRFVVLTFNAASATALTQTVRLSLPSQAVPLSLTFAKPSTGTPEITLYEIGEGRAKLKTLYEITSGEVQPSWLTNAGTSTYAIDRKAFLDDQGGGSWVIEASGPGPLFGWTLLPGSAGAVPPAAKSYLDYAANDGAALPAQSSCLDEVYAAIEDGKLGGRVSRACAGETLVDVGSVLCSETPKAGEIASAGLRCGPADDLAFVLGGLRPDLAEITRHRGLIANATPDTLEISLTPGANISFVSTAAEADLTGCVLGNAGASGTGGAGGWSGSGGSGDFGGSGYGAYGGGNYYGGNAGDAGDTSTNGEPAPDPNANVDVSCSTSNSGGDSCSGDSSDSSSNGDSCGSDSSNSSDGDTCSGDSSDSSDGDTCSGSSDSSGDGDTCSGDSGSSGDGETCSGGGDSGGDTCGGGSSSGGGDCSISHVRVRKIRVSALTLLLAGLALVMRRRTRTGRGNPKKSKSS